eukprot:GDKI01036182.1.p1 GENE.GDKI01036182.1~~GDKI01036182.1.p1  ORF type:complete len:142 (-),score=10.99 GDKI01036182.1:293-718(-)
MSRSLPQSVSRPPLSCNDAMGDEPISVCEDDEYDPSTDYDPYGRTSELTMKTDEIPEENIMSLSGQMKIRKRVDFSQKKRTIAAYNEALAHDTRPATCLPSFQKDSPDAFSEITTALPNNFSAPTLSPPTHARTHTQADTV